MTRFLGVNQRATVTRSSEPSLSSCSNCTDPLPNVLSPISTGAAIVLERAGYDLATRWPAHIDQHYHLDIGAPSGRRMSVRLLGAILEALDQHHAALGQEQPRCLDRLDQQAARIAAQVQDQPGKGSAPAEILDRGNRLAVPVLSNWVSLT